MTMKFQQDTEETRVLFRVSDGEVVAVFPDIWSGVLVACYAHVGQHGACSREWYYSTRPAKPEEYADLMAELEGAPYGYRLKVLRRWSR
jgi:hypothetical protein